MTIRTPLQTGSILSVVHTEANLAALGYLIPGANRAAADRLSAMILKPPKRRQKRSRRQEVDTFWVTPRVRRRVP